MAWTQKGKRVEWDGDRNPNIDIKVPGLERGEGRNKDRLQLSGLTKDKALYDGRVAMLKRLGERMMFEPLRALYDNKITLRELEIACAPGAPADAIAKLLDAKDRKKLRELTGAFLGQYHAGVKGVRRMEDILTQLLDFLGGADAATPDMLTPLAVNAFIASRRKRAYKYRPNDDKKEMSSSTRNRIRAYVQGFCTWCKANGHIKESPFDTRGAIKKYTEGREEHVRLPELEPDEFQRYLDQVGKIAGADYRMLLWAHIETGADAGEFIPTPRQEQSYQPLTVRMCRLDPGPDESVALRFIRTKTRGRGTKERFVPVTREFAEALRRHIADHELARDDLVFGMCHYDHAYRVHRNAVATVTKQKITRKGLRHLAAIRWRRAGVDLMRVAEYLGLTNLSQVEIYAAYKPKKQEEEALTEKLSATYNKLRMLA
jgi:integrase